nr:RHS repeat-associated core domain-containing protein [Elizabethkingia sp. ASV34]
MKRVIETNAFNFYNQAETGVDPRTGQFFLNYPLLSVVGNDLKGPGISLVLSYSPFTTEDFFGFGKGISITGVSIYYVPEIEKNETQIEAPRVILRDGSNWSVDPVHCKMNSRKTMDCKFKHADEHKLIFHKDGSCEVLREYNLNGKHFHVTQYIISAEGDRIELIWYSNGERLRLQSVADQTGNILAELYYKGTDTESKLLDDTDITLKMYPGSTTECYQVGYKLEADYLSSIKSTDKDKGNRIGLLKIGYEKIDDLNYISNLDYPFGKKLKIGYKEGAFTYNKGKSGEIKLAGVERLETTGVLNQADRVVRYTYTSTNFLGVEGEKTEKKTPAITSFIPSYEKLNHDDHRVRKRSVDPMYQALLTSLYIYGSTETIIKKEKKEGGIVIATTTRTYNNFHLLIEEETTSYNNIVKTEIEYPTTKGKTIENQPPNFHYPHKTTVTNINKDIDKSTGKERDPRLEITLTEYDDYGDLKEIIYPNGNKEDFSWQSPDIRDIKIGVKDLRNFDIEEYGEDSEYEIEILENPIRYLKRKESSFVDRSGGSQDFIKDTSEKSSYTHQYTVPIFITKVRVKDKDKMKVRVKVLPVFICDKIKSYKQDRLLTSIVFTYVTSDTKYLGKVKQIKEELEDTTGGGTKPFVTVIDIDYETPGLNLITTIKQTAPTLTPTPIPTPSPDKLTLKLKKETSLLTGVLLKETNTSGITTEYTYDYLGRIEKQVYAKGTAYSHTKKWVYEPQTDRLQITEEDGLGNKSRTSLNSDGHVIESHLYNLDAEEALRDWYNVYDCCYDVLGRKLAETAYDYTQQDLKNKNQEASIKIETKYEYDVKNNKVIRINADGTKNITKTDIVDLTSTSYDESIECGKSGVVVTKFDSKTLRPAKTEIKKGINNVEVINSIEYNYDNLGRVKKITDIEGASTRFEYDVYNRVTQQILPDNTVIERKYAGHLTTNQVTSIGVRKTRAGAFEELGTRKYDGLGRLIENSVGGRVTSYVYNANNYSFSPDKVVLPGENSLEYSYIKELGYKVSGVIGKYREGNQLLIKSFVYDEKSYSMLSHTEGNYITEYTYRPSGRLKEEHFYQERKKKKKIASTITTLGGLIESYTDITGKVITYTRDGIGRVTKVVNGDIETSVSVDTRCKNVILSKNIKHQGTGVGTSCYYNKLNQEIRRIIAFTDKKGVATNQEFNKKGMLQSKVTILGEHQKLETYQYDKLNRLNVYQISLINSASTPLTPDQIKKIYPKALYGDLYIQEEQYVYDHLNNITTVETTHIDGTNNTATYIYGNNNDPTQLSSVINKGNISYPDKIVFTYDSGGRMTKMLQEKREREEVKVLEYDLEYDIMGRLMKNVTDKTRYEINENTKTKEYQYNALDELIQYDDSTFLYYRGNRLMNKEVAEGSIRYINNVAIENNDTFTLMGKNQNGSVIATQKEEEIEFHNYTPYGYTDPKDLELGYNGELIDQETGVYHLGKGYRAYNPILRRFNCPDSISPFDGGGINPYAYCNNNPVMYTDPSGHLGGWARTSIGLGIAGLGFAALAIATGGASIGLGGAIVLTLDVDSSILGIASGALEKSNPKASAYLGYGALATGAPGLVTALYKLPKAVKAGISWVKGKYYGYGSNTPLAFYHSATPYQGRTAAAVHVISKPGNRELVVVGHGGLEVLVNGETDMISLVDRTVNFHTPKGTYFHASANEVVDGLQALPVESVIPGRLFENRFFEAGEATFVNPVYLAWLRINILDHYQPEIFAQMNHDFLIMEHGRTDLRRLFSYLIPHIERRNGIHYSDIHMAMCRPNLGPLESPDYSFRRLPV